MCIRDRARANSLVAALALLMAACSGSADNHLISLSLPQSSSLSESQTATQREHARILASYGGVYENARLQAEIEKTVDRLVAVSYTHLDVYKRQVLYGQKQRSNRYRSNCAAEC